MIKRLCFFLAMVCIISEGHSIVFSIYPESVNVDARDWFVVPVQFEINALWWLKGLEDTLKWVIVYYVLGQLSKNYNRKLFYVSCLLALKSIIHLVMFLYNYAQTYVAYWVTGVFFIGIIVTMFLPIKEKPQGIVRSIE